MTDLPHPRADLPTPWGTTDIFATFFVFIMTALLQQLWTKDSYIIKVNFFEDVNASF